MITMELRVSPGVRKMIREASDLDLRKGEMWRTVINDFTAAVQENFDRQGRPRWAPLSVKYSIGKHARYTLTGKRRKRPPKLGAKRHKVLQLSGHLRKGASGTKAHGFRATANKRSLTLAVRGIPYAARHNYGYKGGGGRGHATTPRRTFFVNPDGSPAMTKKELTDMQQHLKERITAHLVGILKRERLST